MSELSGKNIVKEVTKMTWTEYFKELYNKYPKTALVLLVVGSYVGGNMFSLSSLPYYDKFVAVANKLDNLDQLELKLTDLDKRVSDLESVREKLSKVGTVEDAIKSIKGELKNND